jgi:glycosyltransferase involved in cell wall biosynthesis
MRLLFVADGRSPIALQWMQYFVDAGHEVHLVTTFAAQPNLKLASLQHVPVAYSSAASAPGPRRGLRAVLPASLRTSLRNLAGPLTLPAAAAKLEPHIASIQPDLVHALRIPYEGMLAAYASFTAPLLISSWGNDLTLHARSTPLMANATRRAMQRASALHSDTQRDLRLAHEWGFANSKPSLVMPGNGGVRRDIFHSAASNVTEPRIVNPRGLRAYVRNDVFFKAVADLITEIPTLQVDCPAMQGEAQAEAWVRQYGLQDHVNLLPKLTPLQLADCYRRAAVLVSPSIHDGTPNTLLEAMACGLLPVASDLESIREWITDGENGLLADATDTQALAAAMRRALTDSTLRMTAVKHNAQLIAERADYKINMPIAEKFYESLV